MRVSEIVNYERKKNLSFVALGRCQIEFFDIDGDRYFCAYIHSGTDGYQREVAFRLSDVCISSDVNGGFFIKSEKTIYRFEVNDSSDPIKASISKYLWGWLRYKKFSGDISRVGLVTINNEFGKYAGM